MKYTLFSPRSIILKTSLPLLLVFSALVTANPFTVSVISDQLHHPWSVSVLPDGSYLVTEKAGQLRRISTTGHLSEPILGTPSVAVVGQGGLLDVLVHPDFTRNQWIYLSYVSGSPVRGYSTSVMRGRLQDNTLTDQEILFEAQPKTKGGRHFGSRLLIDADRYLYISLGDRGLRSPAQDLSNHIGSLIRLHDNGQTPKDNPFVDKSNARPEIYSYGHRNIQGLALHPKTGDVWLHEHGPQGGDELNRIESGKNYGWPIITYGVNYGIGTSIGEGTHKAGLEQPKYIWTPSIAPSGLAFYQDSWWIGALKFQLLAQLTPILNSSSKTTTHFTEMRWFEKTYGRIRDVRVNPYNQSLYLLTDASQGRLLKLTSASDLVHETSFQEPQVRDLLKP